MLRKRRSWHQDLRENSNLTSTTTYHVLCRTLAARTYAEEATTWSGLRMKQKLEATPLHRYTSRIVNSPKPRHSSNSGLVTAVFFVFASASSIDGAHGADFIRGLTSHTSKARTSSDAQGSSKRYWSKNLSHAGLDFNGSRVTFWSWQHLLGMLKKSWRTGRRPSLAAWTIVYQSSNMLNVFKLAEVHSMTWLVH